MINGGKELFYEKNYAKIGVNTDDDVPLNQSKKFPTLTIIIRCAFQKGENGIHKSISMKELIFQMKLMLICQINQKNTGSVIIGIF